MPRNQPSAGNQAIGQYLKSLRKRSGKKVWEIARELGMSEGNYLWYESGRNSLPLLKLDDFARAYGIEGLDGYKLGHELIDIMGKLPE
jgi:transcriptional regulator with XRE-family HTH domain